MDGNIRTLLRDKAEEMRIDTSIPGEVLRRSRRRRAATTGVAALVTIGVVGGAFVGARALLSQTAGEDRRVGPAGNVPGETIPQPYPFIFPPTREELEVVAGGHISLWQSPRGVAEMFAINVMGWVLEDIEADVRGDQPITAVITNPSLSEAAGAQSDIRTSVFMVEIPSPGPRIYAVLGARAETMNVEPVGPNQEFGAGDTLAFRGRLDFVPEGGAIVLSVDGAPGTSVIPDPDGRFEVTAETPRGITSDPVLSVALVDQSGLTLALTAGRLGSPVAVESESGTSGPVPVERPVKIPDPVADTRQAILEAAQADDWEALRDLIPGRGFTFSYGGERDPIAYWKNLESEGHVPLLGDVVPRVLGTEPGRVQGAYIWPAQAGEDPSEWDERDLAVLRELHIEEDIRLFQEIGLYTGWRIEIARDGTWLSFVQGD